MSRRLVARWLAAVVAVATAISSGHALIWMAHWSGTPWVLTPALPLAVDGAGAVGAMRWIEGGRGRRWGTAVAIAALLLSMAANASHAAVVSSAWFAPFVGALIPASLWVVIHLLSIPDTPARGAKRTIPAAPKPQPQTTPAPEPKADEVSRHRDTRVTAEATDHVLTQWKAGRRVTGAELDRRTGRSGWGRTHLTRLRRDHPGAEPKEKAS